MSDERQARQARMFSDSNRVRFSAPLGDADRQWWIGDIYIPFDLTPEDIGDRLSASWAGDRRMNVTELNGREKRFAISVVGEFGRGEFLLIERTLDFRGQFVNADRMFVAAGHRQTGLGRRFMADTVALARALRLNSIRLEAEDIGRYVWLRCGFIPDRGSWNAIKPLAIQRIVEARDSLKPARFIALLNMADTTDPAAARELAQSDDPVPSRALLDFDARPAEIPLGKAIFIEASPVWSGSLDLRDPASVAVLERYVDEKS
jgi:GNAT superfamily N-acetyltransferase